MPPSTKATSTQLPSALLCRLFFQRASNELARTPLRTGGTAVSLPFGEADRGPSVPVRSRPIFSAQFPVQLHASAVSVDNSRGVNPSVDALF
ncbi:hypothetical protein GCM10010279_19340 [Streptomyces mutabilis]|nr:hypothetical protein GCM10010279_19340 [Streptomyces mutabilis]